MSKSLYQKYRPQTFSQMVGQEHVRTTLINEIKNDTVSHAYLFSGPRGVGKTTTARLLARAVNFPEIVDEAEVGEDAAGREILDGTAMDIIEIDAASHTGVDNVRENIIEHARVSPVSLKRKVFIIDEVHMLSTSAFNALLKTLEEPPKNVVFILATTEIHKVPSTIISRCERFTFRSIGFDAMLERLRTMVEKEGRRIDEDVLKIVTKRSEGALRDAESLLGQLLSLEGEHITKEMAELVLPYSDTQEIVALWQELLRKQAGQAISRVNRLLNDGVDLNQFTKDLVEFLRKILLYRVQESLSPLQYLDLSQEDIQQVTAAAQNVTPMAMTRMIGVVMRAQELSQTAVIPQLPLELAIVTVCDAPSIPTAKPQPPTQAPPSAGGGTPAASTPSAPAQTAASAPAQPAPVKEQQVSADEVEGEIQYEPLTDEELAAEEAANDGHAEGGEQEPDATKASQPEKTQPVQAQNQAAAAEEEKQSDQQAIAAAVAQHMNEQPPADAIQTHTQMATPSVQAAPAQEQAQPAPATEQTTPQAVESAAAQEPQNEVAAQPEAAQVSEPVAATGELSLAIIQNRWNDILEAVNKENHALHVSLKVGQVAGVTDGKLILGFEYEFYKDRLEDGGNAQIIEQAVESVINAPVRLEVMVGKEFSAPTGEHTNIEQPSEDEVANIWDLAAASNFRPQEG